MENTEFLLEMRGIDKVFPGTHALDHVDFNLRKGEIHALIGQNGSGKSTLMNILSGSYEPTQGKLVFDGESMQQMNPIYAQEKGIAMIHQELSLSNALSVAENI